MTSLVMDTNAPEKKTEKKTYGWYSENMLAATDSLVVYRHVDGREVNCTIVSQSPTEHSSMWTDIVCLGEVTGYLRSVGGGGGYGAPGGILKRPS